MAVNQNLYSCTIIFIILFDWSKGLNLGLFAGDKRGGSPLVIKKNTHHSPIFINIKPSPLLPPISPKLPKPPPLVPLKPIKSFKLPKPPLAAKLPKSLKLPKPPKLPKPLKFSESPILAKSSSSLLRKLGTQKLPKLSFLKSPFSKLRSPILPPIIKPVMLPILPPLIPKVPFIPRLPLMPFLPPPLLPLPLLPILPPPLIPIVPRLKSSIFKTPLQRALGSELKPVIVPSAHKDDLLEKLRKLRKQGSLTTAEFTKFKKILLKRR